MLTVLGHRGGRRFTSAFTTVLSSQRSPPNSQHALCHASGFGQRGQWGLSPPGPPSTPPHKNNLLGSAQNMTCTPTRRRLNNLSLSLSLSLSLTVSVVAGWLTGLGGLSASCGWMWLEWRLRHSNWQTNPKERSLSGHLKECTANWQNLPGLSMKSTYYYTYYTITHYHV